MFRSCFPLKNTFTWMSLLNPIQNKIRDVISADLRASCLKRLIRNFENKIRKVDHNNFGSNKTATTHGAITREILHEISHKW